MMKIYIVIFCLLNFVNAYSQFIQNNSRSLFSDVKAFKEGDAIMVFIVEDVQADNNATTNTDRNSSVGADFGFSTGTGSTNMGVDLGTDNDHRSQGRTIRNERIRSKLSARVTGVENNGNLIIEGKRTTNVNNETQTITIRGVVRPVDVRPDNSIYSYSILDLTLLIEGDGSVSEIQEPGLITKFIRLLF